ncbi:NifU family protein [Marinilabilia salmonicolor]|jgi:Fe-S cluster biogenesis protein NfuA|uniref:Fe-S cluster biogenesis protein NfuA n=1 Tax=Marinilabilia salmonicolor TaxID=989 RepID=A0A2T0XLH3_9BACT|nr:NifU family protein [Marinilabilia salmonicolor]PRY99783.1 Fe-S cluster biogenesis protein NfuA [Marinilabilia salmonicolor]RCW37421.1 Fe-S cluster biogenesis protein NfuA [Marinilabilia salmonicolor]
MEKEQLKQRVLEALESIRPYLQSDGGDIVFVELTDDMQVKVQLTGACDGCPMSLQTLKGGVEMVVKQKVPEILEVVAVH